MKPSTSFLLDKIHHELIAFRSRYVDSLVWAWHSRRGGKLEHLDRIIDMVEQAKREVWLERQYREAGGR